MAFEPKLGIEIDPGTALTLFELDETRFEPTTQRYHLNKSCLEDATLQINVLFNNYMILDRYPFKLNFFKKIFVFVL